MTTEQEARGVEMVWNYLGDDSMCWSYKEQDNRVVAYLIPYFKSRGMLGGLK